MSWPHTYATEDDAAPQINEVLRRTMTTYRPGGEINRWNLDLRETPTLRIRRFRGKFSKRNFIVAKMQHGAMHQMDYLLHHNMRKPMKKTAIPRHLKAGARRMYRELLSDYEINDSAGRAILQAACESFQRAQEARAILDKAGPILIDRFGQEKIHPVCAVERDAKASMISALRALKLAPGDAE